MAEKVGSVQIVIKGGRPWGFTLQGGVENKSALTVAEIEPHGKAELHGSLRVGDHVIKINDVHCLSLTDALQLIDCAFRTLTLLVWRSSNELPPPSNAKDSETPGFIPAVRRRKHLLSSPPRGIDGSSQISPGDYSQSSDSLRLVPDAAESSVKRNHLRHNSCATSNSSLSLPNDFHSVKQPLSRVDGDSNALPRNSSGLEEHDENMVSRRFDKKKSVYKALENKSGLDFAPVLQRQPGWERREFFESMTSDSGYQEDADPANHLAVNTNNTFEAKNSFGTSFINEHERAISPPSIPSRNSSLRYCHSSAHEKYPSWPVTSPQFSNAKTPANAANHRSSSWAEHMGTPKESHAPYSRPQKLYHISTQQLHPVQEKTTEGHNKAAFRRSDISDEHHQVKKLTEAEQLSADAIARFFEGSYFEMQLPRDKEYKAHSPPERDPPAPQTTLSYMSLDDDVYNKNYENMLRYYSKSPALYGKWIKESSLHPDSATPLLDRLRLEKDNISTTWSLFEESVVPRDAFTRCENAPSYRHLKESRNPSTVSSDTGTLACNSSSQETLKMRSSYSDLDGPYWCPDRSYSKILPSGRDVSEYCETASTEAESYEENKTSRWDISNLLCSSRSNSCWSLADKKRSPKDRCNNSNINNNNRNNERNNVHGFSMSFPGFSAGTRMRTSSTTPQTTSEPLNPITSRSHSLSFSTETLDSEPSRGLVSPHRGRGQQRTDQSYDSHRKTRKSHRIPEPELKAIQKQAVLSFYHRQRGLNSTPVNSSQETSPPPPPPSSSPFSPRNIDRQTAGSSTCTETIDQNSDFADCELEDFKEGASDRIKPVSSFWSGGCGRKAQLKKIYDDSETAIVKIVSSDGVTLAESVQSLASPRQDLEEEEEFRQIEECAQNLLRVPTLSTSVSPDLPLPSPPPVSDDEVKPSDEPLPPPPPSLPSVEQETNEALYVNLEELKLNTSPSQLVNSSTQTTMSRHQNNTVKSQAEVDCEQLSKDFVSHIGDLTLRNILVPSTDHRTMSDYMKGLLNLELEKGGKPTPRLFLPNKNLNDCAMEKKEEKIQRNVSLPLTSAYFTTSEPKAKLLTRYSQNFDKKNWITESELKGKREELTASISKKLEILKIEQIALKEEVKQNDELGNELTAKVEMLAKPNEIEKYRLHVEELEKIINLLLSLSGRLARAQNALLILPKDATMEEKCILEAKRDKLSQQHEEARYLKENIDKRSFQVSLFLHNYFTLNEYADYDHFIKMKSKLLMDAREIDEKIKLGEEQLAALRNSIDTETWSCSTMDIFSDKNHKVINA